MKRFLLLAVLVIATACGGGSDGATATLTVSPAPVATVIVALSTSTVIAGMPTTATVTLRDDRGNTLSNRAVTWSSSAPTVATVDVAGTVTTLIPGATTVTATSEGKSGVASLVVIPPPVATVAVALSQSVIAPGRTTTASAVLRDANGIALADRPITWNSSATGVATVDANGGIVALTPGSAIISAVSEGKSGSATLTVQLPPVATITVVGASSIAPGATANFSATLRDASGALLNGRAIGWSTSDPSIAQVNASGVVTGVAPGSVAITATSEGKAGTALVAIKYNITSVVMTGSGRIKVGDSYTYTATARLADGTVVNRPVSWNVKEAGKGTIGPTGVLTPLQTGTITLQAIIDGDVWESTFSAYDWQSFTSSGSQFASVEADIQITNKFGTSEYPQLVMSCSASGNFFVWISTTNFVTQNGFVAMSFDGGAAFSQTWDELSPNYRTLWKPGSNGTIKAFAQQIAATRLFGFAFTEFQGQAKATIFRVSGLSSRLAPMIALCPGNAIMATVEQLAKSEAMGSAMMSSSAISSPQLTALRASRALAPPSIGGTPLPQLDAPTASIPQLQQAVRVKR